MKEIRKDILGVVPQIGDTIVFNPPHYKGLVYGTCVGFSKVGLPLVDVHNPKQTYIGNKTDGFYSPKTGFTVSKVNNQFTNIENYVKGGVIINGNEKDGYRIFTENTQWFEVKSLNELCGDKFEKEIERLKYYDCNFKKVHYNGFYFYYSDEIPTHENCVDGVTKLLWFTSVNYTYHKNGEVGMMFDKGKNDHFRKIIYSTNLDFKCS